MRPENWCKWDLDSRSGLKMAVYFNDRGALGYGFFMVLVEMLYRDAAHKLPHDDGSMQNYAKLCKIDFCIAKELLHDLHEHKLFERDETHFWSRRVLEEIAEREGKKIELSSKRKSAANARWHKRNEQTGKPEQVKLPMQSHAKPCKPMQSHANDARGEERRLDKNNKEPLAPEGNLFLIFPPNLNNSLCKQAWQNWLDHKKSKGQKYKSVKTQQQALNNWAAKTAGEFCNAVAHSIGANYSGIYPAPVQNGTKTQEQNKDIKHQTTEWKELRRWEA